MQCVYYDRRLPNGFEEHFTFSPEMPYSIGIKRFPVEDIVPLHYAKTIEILLCEDLCGEIVIDHEHYLLGQQQLFVIPPYTIHSNNIRPGAGAMYVLKIDLHEMNRYILLENCLAGQGCPLGQLRYSCPEYPAVKKIVEDLIRKDGNLLACLPLILELFSLLSRHTDPSRNDSASHTRFKSSSLQELIRWTNENYGRKITLEEVAAMTGYSKYHFSRRFKSQTGMTYMEFLNSVRVSHACLMLQKGESVQAVCRCCGFENSSYFIQMFKKIQHITPHQYAAQQKSLLP